MGFTLPGFEVLVASQIIWLVPLWRLVLNPSQVRRRRVFARSRSDAAAGLLDRGCGTNLLEAVAIKVGVCVD